MKFGNDFLDYQFFPRLGWCCRTIYVLAVFLLSLVLLPTRLSASVSAADYERGLSLREKYQGLVLHLPDSVEWVDGTNRFVYRRTVPGGQIGRASCRERVCLYV